MSAPYTIAHILKAMPKILCFFSSLLCLLIGILLQQAIHILKIAFQIFHDLLYIFKSNIKAFPFHSKHA